MKYKLSLTNEALSRQFNSSFEMVRYCIDAAAQLVNSGRPPRVSIEEENPAVIVVEEIAAGKDNLPENDLVQIAINEVSEVEEDELKIGKKSRK